MHVVYIVRCTDNSLYCGQTNNLERRLKEHASAGKKSAKYLRSRLPFSLVHSERHKSLSEALKREKQIKSWPKSKKERLIAGRFI